VSSRDAYLFLNLVEEDAVVAGRLLMDSAAARRRLAVRYCKFADMSYVVMIPEARCRQRD
jgi:hypothetical protein